MEFFVNCNASPLDPQTGPLDASQVAHLYRRLGFSTDTATINAGVGQTANTLVDNLIGQAQAMAPMTPPEWATWNNASYPADDAAAGDLKRSQIADWKLQYTRQMLSNNLRDRISFFWSNHFVTQLQVYNCPAYLHGYTNCLQRNALGNFKTFTSEIGLTDAMLYYLDGVYNTGNNPNENYARELYELFTLGEGQGYTEEDIIETAKAISGYVERGEEGCSPVSFDATRFNTENKTIFGQTGNWGYDDVIDILFEQRGDRIAYYICRKLYEFFVHPDAVEGNAPNIIQGLADTFTANNFELAPVLSQLFKSQHFFDDDAVGVIIKSPFDLFLQIFKETGFPTDDSLVNSAINASRLLGQQLFDPVEVEGWQRNRTWINTNFMIGRWLTAEMVIDLFFQTDQEQFRALAEAAVGPANTGTSNPRLVTEALVNKFLPKGLLTEQDLLNALDTFMVDTVPENYYGLDFIDGGLGYWMLNTSDAAPTQVYLLLQHLARQPEFQLK
ncbi:DUF1800 domain-containing protein [Sediminicola luteus]|uniref:DUF1800 domain-containing protein n=1 Tax=Sediminicola luteus TaxID=319238 RepID=A0A2A4GG66_9FLAO|nr:DUF1800 domain-containing protein [Sediminicola luteus]PCE66765.1 hypothetical protein B7P33_02310 [Sediminicola luteus]